MVSTVTTATMIAVTTITTSLALIGVCTLLALLIQRELIAGSRRRFTRTLGRVLNVGIIPLLMGFALIVIVRVIEALK